MCLDKYASVFTELGIVCVVFDYRHFGDSGGLPRCLLSLNKQLQDFKTVIDYARRNPDSFQNNKIVVMGTALSGLYISELATSDADLAGAMAQCPMLDGT